MRVVVKSKKNGASLVKTLPDPVTDLAPLPKALEEFDFGEQVRSTASMLGVSPESLVEMFITKTYSRVVKRLIYHMPSTLAVLERLENDTQIRDLVLRKNYVLGTKDRRDIENKYINEKVIEESQALFDNMVELANGARYTRMHPKTGEVIELVAPPNRSANEYLLNRVLGKPAAVSEADGKRGATGSIGKVQIFLPSNGRGDGPPGATIDYSEIRQNAIEVEESDED